MENVISVSYTHLVDEGLPTQANLCKQITVIAAPAVVVNNPPAICAGKSAKITANGAKTYVWSPAVGLNTTTGAVSYTHLHCPLSIVN